VGLASSRLDARRRSAGAAEPVALRTRCRPGCGETHPEKVYTSPGNFRRKFAPGVPKSKGLASPPLQEAVLQFRRSLPKTSSIRNSQARVCLGALAADSCRNRTALVLGSVSQLASLGTQVRARSARSGRMGCVHLGLGCHRRRHSVLPRNGFPGTFASTSRIHLRVSGKICEHSGGFRAAAFSHIGGVLDCALQSRNDATADAWNFGLCATIPREPRQARKGATVPGTLRVPRSTRSSSHRFWLRGIAAVAHSGGEILRPAERDSA